MVTLDGEVKGQHDGLMYHTIGQRQGLGIGGGGTSQEPWFVVGKRFSNKHIVCGDKGFHHPALYADRLEASQIHFTTDTDRPSGFKCTAKFRYRQQDVGVSVRLLDNDRAEVIFDEPVRAITPGQAVVFYDGMECLGGGLIDAAYQEAKRIAICLNDSNDCSSDSETIRMISDACMDLQA